MTGSVDFFSSKDVSACPVKNDVSTLMVIDENGSVCELYACKHDLAQQMEYFNRMFYYETQIQPDDGKYQINITSDTVPESIRKFCGICIPDEKNWLISHTDMILLLKTMFKPHWLYPDISQPEPIPKEAKCFYRLLQLAVVFQCRRDYFVRLVECLMEGLENFNDEYRFLMVDLVFYVRFNIPNFHADEMIKLCNHCVDVAAPLQKRDIKNLISALKEKISEVNECDKFSAKVFELKFDQEHEHNVHMKKRRRASLEAVELMPYSSTNGGAVKKCPNCKERLSIGGGEEFDKVTDLRPSAYKRVRV